MGLDMMINKIKKKEGIDDKEYLKTLECGDGEEIAYWRKANMVHKWIYENCATEGQKDYDNILITKEKIKDLLLDAYRVKNSIELIDGDVVNGSRFINGKWEPNIEKGKTIKDCSICKELLPTQSGFFFGSTSYDEYYLEDIDLTIKNLENVLKSVDWDTEFTYYWASY